MIDKICLVKDLTETEGASGFEENVVDIIKNYGKDFIWKRLFKKCLPWRFIFSTYYAWFSHRWSGIYC